MIFDDLKAIIDTGTSVMVGPMDIVSEITAALPKEINCADLDNK